MSDMFSEDLVRAGRLELPLPKKTDFESAASTDSATPALMYQTYEV